MSITWFLVAVLLIAVSGYFAAQGRVLRMGSANAGLSGQQRSEKSLNHFGLRSLPRYYAYYAFLWAVLPTVAAWILYAFLFRILNGTAFGWAPLSPTVFYSGLTLVALAGALYAAATVRAELNLRKTVETTVIFLLGIGAAIAIIITVGIVASVLREALIFFWEISPLEFFFGIKWSVQTAIREGQSGASGSFGAVPVFAGTFMITIIAMFVAVPLGLLSAIYLSEYASATARTWLKPVLEILAGIPTVVYGVFAALTVAPFIRNAGDWLSATLSSWTGAQIVIDVSAQSALAAGAVMGIMIIPFVSSLSDDAIQAVPQNLRDGSLGLGATQSETIRKVILPAALPGISGGILLAVSRAIGETMIVVMAAGLFAQLTANPLDAVSTVTVQIVSLLTGDTEFDSAKTRSAFALGLTLFMITLFLNVLAMRIVRKYGEKYL